MENPNRSESLQAPPVKACRDQTFGPAVQNAPISPNQRITPYVRVLLHYDDVYLKYPQKYPRRGATETEKARNLRALADSGRD